MIEINQLQAVRSWLNSAVLVLPPRAVQSLDLSSCEAQLCTKRFPDSLFLGCILSDQAAGHIVQTGGVVLPNASNLLFKSHLAHLYHRDELFKGFDIERLESRYETLDHRIYEQYLAQGREVPNTIHTSLMRRLHDHSITNALQDLLEGQKVVAIMGGHGVERRDPTYKKVALIARTLTQNGFLMVSGGGPGVMEATHLGAYFAPLSLAELDEALVVLSLRPAGAVPKQEYNDQDWLHRAMQVVQRFPLSAAQERQSKSIGIPTWLYGHEPPAVFATHIAKYFANSVREDGLLQIAKHGVIFAEGSAGTTQEIFQDACQNHYAAYNSNPLASKSYVSPMILMGRDYWTTQRPVWPLLQEVAQGRPYGKLLALTDDAQEVIQRIQTYDPLAHEYPKVLAL
jgi:predicted Rossmann-fold nucleotide-binding protein